MNYAEVLSIEEKTIIYESIEKYLLENDYHNAFHFFIIHISRMNFVDRDELIYYFHNYFREKCSNQK